jgi:hypothetical protein
MQRKYRTRRHITVYLDDEEYLAIQSRCGGGRVSQWARDVILERLNGGRDVAEVAVGMEKGMVGGRGVGAARVGGPRVGKPCAKCGAIFVCKHKQAGV